MEVKLGEKEDRQTERDMEMWPSGIKRSSSSPFRSGLRCNIERDSTLMEESDSTHPSGLSIIHSRVQKVTCMRTEHAFLPENMNNNPRISLKQILFLLPPSSFVINTHTHTHNTLTVATVLCPMHRGPH